MATVLANGNSLKTARGNIFAKEGPRLELFREDDFKKQTEAYLAGKIPFRRGAMGMLNLAAELLSKDPRTRPVVVCQLSWSRGGDCLVVKPGINRAADLKGAVLSVPSSNASARASGEAMFRISPASTLRQISGSVINVRPR
jgi:ABC-type nitrate/sulfonate/bicarbonate transport system substrate-binding protein